MNVGRTVAAFFSLFKRKEEEEEKEEGAFFFLPIYLVGWKRGNFFSSFPSEKYEGMRGEKMGSPTPHFPLFLSSFLPSAVVYLPPRRRPSVPSLDARYSLRQ